ncbi:hypothetical protein F2Q70_00038793 [Brassica cretica]|uniref:Uncharacterized protein n=1 Tax=Brassica cretica TaxID=69181 RepID=A0A8S9KA77_BRACR|nr:hypothetical protein F2Q70_00038793 [Brassica cretica]KAF2617376.1 hypothetical protein F2Q68_00039466 [Brassica cretica]
MWFRGLSQTVAELPTGVTCLQDDQHHTGRRNSIDSGTPQKLRIAASPFIQLLLGQSSPRLARNEAGCYIPGVRSFMLPIDAQYALASTGSTECSANSTFDTTLSCCELEPWETERSQQICWKSFSLISL